MPFCGQGSIAGYTHEDITLICLRCKRWQCHHCLKDRLNQLKALAQRGYPTTLITLTVKRGAYDTPDEAARALVRAWRNVRQRARREGLARSIPFVAIFEATKAGWPHIHILARCPYIDQRWISERMDEYAGSPIVDIRRVKTARGAARYVAKYVSKGPGRFDGCKRYWRSQDYELEAKPDSPVADRGAWWEMRRESIEEIAANLQKCGWVLSSESAETIVLEPGPDAKYLWRCSGAGPPIE